MKPLITNVTTIGDSKGIILPQPILKAMGLERGGQVELRLDGEQLLVSPVRHRYATPEEAEKAKEYVFKKYAALMKRLAKR